MDAIDTSAKALVEHWSYAADKGLMNQNTATALKIACTKVLEVLDGWEDLEVKALDLDAVWRRFVNKRSKEFKPKSLETYRRRFRLAVKKFLEYAEDPTGWRPTSQPRVARKPKESAAANNGEALATDVPASQISFSSAGGLVEYPFPLREGRLAYLRLPMDLKKADVKRLTAYLNTLAVDFEADA